MKIIGLCGGIASGKDFVADIFAKKGAIIFDADKEVHNILNNDETAFSEVSKHFSESIISGKINRKILGEIVFSDKSKLKILENIIHPKVRQKYQDFLRNSKSEIVVLNIPLLLESSGYKCDKIIALSLSKDVQKERFLNRQKILNPQIHIQKLEEKFENITASQMKNEERESCADFVVDTGFSKEETVRQIEEIIAKL